MKIIITYNQQFFFWILFVAEKLRKRAEFDLKEQSDKIIEPNTYVFVAVTQFRSDRHSLNFKVIFMISFVI
jgi:hypothetical protein